MMGRLSEILKTHAEKLETPFAIQHVESHLIFGPLSRYVPVGLLVLIGGIIHLAWSLFSGPSGVPRGQYIGDTLDIVVVEIILLPLILLQATRRQQSIIAWGVTNIKFGIAFGIMLIISEGRFFS